MTEKKRNYNVMFLKLNGIGRYLQFQKLINFFFTHYK
jgi:hypothetical protein